MILALWYVAVFTATVSAIYEDQIGKFDWLVAEIIYALMVYFCIFFSLFILKTF